MDAASAGGRGGAWSMSSGSPPGRALRAVASPSGSSHISIHPDVHVLVWSYVLLGALALLLLLLLLNAVRPLIRAGDWFSAVVLRRPQGRRAEGIPADEEAGGVAHPEMYRSTSADLLLGPKRTSGRPTRGEAPVNSHGKPTSSLTEPLLPPGSDYPAAAAVVCSPGTQSPGGPGMGTVARRSTSPGPSLVPGGSLGQVATGPVLAQPYPGPGAAVAIEQQQEQEQGQQKQPSFKQGRQQQSTAMDYQQYHQHQHSEASTSSVEATPIKPTALRFSSDDWWGTPQPTPEPAVTSQTSPWADARSTSTSPQSALKINHGGAGGSETEFETASEPSSSIGSPSTSVSPGEAEQDEEEEEVSVVYVPPVNVAARASSAGLGSGRSGRSLDELLDESGVVAAADYDAVVQASRATISAYPGHHHHDSMQGTTWPLRLQSHQHHQQQQTWPQDSGHQHTFNSFQQYQQPAAMAATAGPAATAATATAAEVAAAAGADALIIAVRPNGTVETGLVFGPDATTNTQLREVGVVGVAPEAVASAVGPVVEVVSELLTHLGGGAAQAEATEEAVLVDEAASGEDSEGYCSLPLPPATRLSQAALVTAAKGRHGVGDDAAGHTATGAGDVGVAACTAAGTGDRDGGGGSAAAAAIANHPPTPAAADEQSVDSRGLQHNTATIMEQGADGCTAGSLFTEILEEVKHV